MPSATGTSIGSFLGLHALTSLHPGSGTALGTVDLPVQRERHTQWPTIGGSAIKGVLRDVCREKKSRDYQDDADQENGFTKRGKANKDDQIKRIFGPPDAAESAGAVSVTDARLLAYPVRSMKGVFAWVSCPAVLERLKRDAMLAGVPTEWTVPTVKGTEAAADPMSPCWIDNSLILEEFDYTRLMVVGDSLKIAEWIATNLFPTDESYLATRERFQKQFVILADDEFTQFARHATEISARIALDYETKTVKDGALFYQEYLPTETLLYSVVLMNSARTKWDGESAKRMTEMLKELLPPVIQIGGDETVGKGYCAVRLMTGGN
jgi:CRISPR-associated protein Cmr4